ncbi:MAG: hypothetical protein ACYC4R_02195 [Anaerolineae bacterium]
MDRALWRRIVFGCIALAVALVLAACARLQEASDASSESAFRPIVVEDVQVQVGVGSPIPVDVFVSGTWPDLCAQLAEITQQVEGQHITVTLLATEVDADCPPDYLGVPFRIAIPLNGVELPEGTYTIMVNDVSTEFTWPAQ